MKDYKPYFKRFTERMYQQQAGELLAVCQQHYERIKPDIAFSFQSPNPIDRRLDFSAYVLALIKTLEQKGLPKEEIRAYSLQIVGEYVKPVNKLEAGLKKLWPIILRSWPGSYLIRILQKKVSIAGHPDGFNARIIKDKQLTYGFEYGIDILDCGICKLYNRHGMGSYSSLLCEIDELTSGLAGLELIRTGTIANGAKVCDFRFMPVQK